jgi:hypothetical protein
MQIELPGSSFFAFARNVNLDARAVTNSEHGRNSCGFEGGFL